VIATDWIYFANESRAERGSTLARAKSRGLLPLRAFVAGKTTTPVPHATALRPGQTVLLAVSARRGWRPVAVCRIARPPSALTHPNERGRAWNFPALVAVADEDVPVDPLMEKRTAIAVTVESEIAESEAVFPHKARAVLQPGNSR
jgi:hypothetical protein